MQEKQLKSGFTTGTCGAAAAKAAAVCLLTGEIKKQIEIMTPKGVVARLKVEQLHNRTEVSFRVQKNSGDDPDVTHGSWVYASLSSVCGQESESWYQSMEYPHLYLTGGEGIGMVTKPGLACPVGKHAINPVPRTMIFEAVESVCEAFDYTEPLLIKIEIPEGVMLAEKTFNPKLGIKDGISVLGTSGVVEPMSDPALLATIQLEIHMKAVEGIKKLILTPGNYGERFLHEQLHLSLDQAVRCSNFIADTMKMLEQEGIEEVLFVGHLGKMIKVAGGIPNTHSKYGDKRMEILAACLDEVHADQSIEKDIKNQVLREAVLKSNTTEEALEYLQTAQLLVAVMERVIQRIHDYLNQWGQGKVSVEVVTFSTVYGILGKSQGADALIKKLAMEET